MATKILYLSRLHFLVVDGNAYMRSIMRSILETLGSYNMLEAGDGGTGLQMLRKYPVDIVIVNWMMRPIDGIEFTRALRAVPGGPKSMLPVILLSAHTERKRVAEARNAGVTEFLSLPLSPKALYLRIEEVILRPRQFVRTKTFYGPDRHRHDDRKYTGARRRQTDNSGPPQD